MARNDPQMNLRVPMELKENIEKAAFENGRTITAEAVYRLEQSFEKSQSQESEIENLRKEIKNMNMTIHTLAEALVGKGK
ncbi:MULTISPECIES: Arc family DNA-binding protein [Acinetobacter]|uniref:Arc-like DNA binding domain-containing protein n=1 Tax=Acinetobacter higginsii TaxID=70347 RepID=N9RLD5_9GAMM|nr:MULTISPECIES: Arc family DNA-binding protein [Acinetobacter]ENX58793.1 hypothetical protein F902_01420 [Acinetobacter higginsii]